MDTQAGVIAGDSGPHPTLQSSSSVVTALDVDGKDERREAAEAGKCRRMN